MILQHSMKSSNYVCVFDLYNSNQSIIAVSELVYSLNKHHQKTHRPSVRPNVYELGKKLNNVEPSS